MVAWWRGPEGSAVHKGSSGASIISTHLRSKAATARARHKPAGDLALLSIKKCPVVRVGLPVGALGMGEERRQGFWSEHNSRPGIDRFAKTP